MNFYDDVLLELLIALGAALFVGNVIALLRRSRQPVSTGNRDSGADLPQAPVVRSVFYAVIGLVVLIWALVSIFS